MLNPTRRLWLRIAAVLFFFLASAPCYTSFVPLRVHPSLFSPSPRSSLPFSTSPSRRPPPYVSRLRSPTVPPFGRASGSRAASADPDATPLPTPSNETQSLNFLSVPPIDITARKTTIEVDKLKVNGEIDAITAKIDAKEAEWMRAEGTDKAVYQKSIDTLYEALKDLRATRAKLIDASIAVPVPVPGKSTPLYEFCALCCRRPPLCVHMRLTSAPLACNYCLLRSSPQPPPH